MRRRRTFSQGRSGKPAEGRCFEGIGERSAPHGLAADKARRAGTSIGELVRRSLDAYDPELDGAELEALLRLLEESHARAMTSLDDTEQELAITRAYFDAKRKPA